MSPFERFFAEEFPRLLDATSIPASAWTTPPAGKLDPSWDRRAAWLIFAKREGVYVDPYAAPPKKPWEEGDL